MARLLARARHRLSDQPPSIRRAARIGQFQRTQQHAGLGAIADAEFFEDRAHVRLDRAFLDAEFIGDLLVEAAIGDPRQHLELLRAQRRQRAASSRSLGSARPARDRFAQRRRQPFLAVEHGAQAGLQFGQVGALGQVTGGAIGRARGGSSPGRRARRSSRPRRPDVRRATTASPTRPWLPGMCRSSSTRSVSGCASRAASAPARSSASPISASGTTPRTAWRQREAVQRMVVGDQQSGHAADTRRVACASASAAHSFTARPATIDRDRGCR